MKPCALKLMTWLDAATTWIILNQQNDQSLIEYCRKERGLRLSAEAINVIQDVFLRVFEKGDLYLFGSRIDDTRKGGDIDLYVVADEQTRLGEKRIDFLTQIKHKIGEQRIDLVIDRGTKRTIDKIAMSEGVLLCQRH